MSPSIRTLSLVAVLALGPSALAACGGSAGDRGGAALAPSLAEVQDETGVPRACREAFPVAVGEADPAAVSLMPASWPEDVVAGTLCQTSSSGSGMQVASYATSASQDEVLDAVEDALPSSYDVTRADQGLGDQLDGAGDGVAFRVTTRDGAYEVTFSEE